jgi:hypothetical protein
MVNCVRRLDHIILHVAAYSVLRTEERRQTDSLPLMKKIRNVLEIMIHRCLIADESDARTT